MVPGQLGVKSIVPHRRYHLSLGLVEPLNTNLMPHPHFATGLCTSELGEWMRKSKGNEEKRSEAIEDETARTVFSPSP